VFNDSGSTTAQQITNCGFQVSNAVGTPNEVAAAAENTNSGSPITVEFVFNVAATDAVTPKAWLVEKMF
jgi:hypothetical protein